MVPLSVVFGASSSLQAGSEQLPIMQVVCWHSRFELQFPLTVVPPLPMARDPPLAAPPAPGLPPVPGAAPPVPPEAALACGLTPAQAPSTTDSAIDIQIRAVGRVIQDSWLTHTCPQPPGAAPGPRQRLVLRRPVSFCASSSSPARSANTPRTQSREPRQTRRTLLSPGGPSALAFTKAQPRKLGSAARSA